MLSFEFTLRLPRPLRLWTSDAKVRRAGRTLNEIAKVKQKGRLGIWLALFCLLSNRYDVILELTVAIFVVTTPRMGGFVNFFEFFCGKMGVNLRRRQRLVAEQLLNTP